MNTEEQQFYRKIGRRYVPAAWYESTDAWAPGTYLVSIEKVAGGRSMHSRRIDARRRPITPSFLSLAAAAQRTEDRLAGIVYEATKFKPANAALNPAQAKAWRALEGAGINSLVAQSAACAAKEILNAILEAAI